MKNENLFPLRCYSPFFPRLWSLVPFNQTLGCLRKTPTSEKPTTFNLSVVRIHSCRHWRTFFTFKSSFPEPMAQFQPDVAQSIHEWRGFKLVKMNVQLRGDKAKYLVKIHWRHLKIFFSRTTGTISTNLGTKHPWVNGIQVYTNEVPRPYPRGYIIANWHIDNI